MSAPHLQLVELLKSKGYEPEPEQVEALSDTPRRWWKAIDEMTRGYQVDIAQVLGRQFDGIPGDNMIVLRDIEFVSLCEHHLMPFTGTACVAYIPNSDRVVGLSKLARLVEAHACRLQVQERMTHDIAHDLMIHLEATGAACIIRGKHSCMSCRGVRKEAEMVTSCLCGVFRTDLAARTEFLNLSKATA